MITRYKTLLLASLITMTMCCQVEAKGRHSGSGYSGRYGPAHSFSSSNCARSSCFAKHPSGTYFHPNTGGERFSRR